MRLSGKHLPWATAGESSRQGKGLAAGASDVAGSAQVLFRNSGFTLIELILVMAVLVIVLGVSAPSLSRFFQGRTLEFEARRFVGLTRYGQSRAVSEGIPVLLWIDPKQGAYGLKADSSYVEEDSKSLEYQVHKDLQLEVEQSVAAQRQASLWKGTGGLAANLPRIRFNPDGFISESSPESILFRQGSDGEIRIGPTFNHLNYEIQTNQLQTLRR
jgi:type IV fimbrial biogenesis protein FimT